MLASWLGVTLASSGPGRAGSRGARLCNFNNIDKLEPASFDAWMAALRRAPRATLTLLRPPEPLGASEAPAWMRP